MQEFYDLLRATSRTFAVGIEALPKPLRDAVTLAYLVLRVSDYFEDSPTLDRSKKTEALGFWAKLVEGDGVDGEASTELEALLRSVAPEDRAIPDQAAALHAATILEGLRRIPPSLRDPIRSHTTRTTRGMIRWIERGSDFPDEAALDDYMYEVAGRVGLLLTDLFSAHSPAVNARRDTLLESAVPFGLGLQTVNVIRGLHEDPSRGWVYVPRHLLPPEFASPQTAADLSELGTKEKMEVLDFFVSKAAHHIADALRYCQTIPSGERGIRVFCIVPALLALRTARRSHGNAETFLAPIKVSRGEVRRIVLISRLLYFSNGWLERERERALGLATGSTTRAGIDPPPRHRLRSPDR